MLSGRSRAYLFRALVLWRLLRDIDDTTGLKREPRKRRSSSVGVMGSDVVCRLQRHLAEEGEAHRVEHRCLARTGVSRDDEQATGGQRGEVNLDLTGIRPEGGEFDLERFHDASPVAAASTAAVRSLRSRSLGPAPCRSVQNAITVSSGSIRSGEAGGAASAVVVEPEGCR